MMQGLGKGTKDLGKHSTVCCFQVLMKTQPTALPHLGISAGEFVTSRDSLLEEKTFLHIFNWFQSPFWLAESC